jgi:hypothetical protein
MTFTTDDTPRSSLVTGQGVPRGGFPPPTPCKDLYFPWQGMPPRVLAPRTVWRPTTVINRQVRDPRTYA